MKILISLFLLLTVYINGMEQPFMDEEIVQLVESPSDEFIEACKLVTNQISSLKYLTIKKLESNQITIEEKVPSEVMEFKAKLKELPIQIKCLMEYKDCPEQEKKFFLNLINNWRLAKQNFPNFWESYSSKVNPNPIESEKQSVYDGILLEAINKNNVYLVNFALTLGANVNIQDINGLTALRHAAVNNYKEIVQLLLDKGADLNAQGHKKFTALMSAAINRHQAKEALEMLIKAGSDLNVQDDNGNTALMWAIMGKYTEVVHMLIKAGADLNIKNITGEAALLAAIRRYFDSQTIQMLIDAGADINATNNDGWSALTWTRDSNYVVSDDVLRVLEQAEKAQKGCLFGKLNFRTN